MSFEQKFLGFRKTSTWGSNWRRLWTRLSAILVLLFFAEAVAAQYGLSRATPELTLAMLTPVWSVTYFTMVVLAIPFLTSHNFRPNPLRLAFDSLVSISLAILSFSLVFRRWGVEGSSPDPAEAIYFATVTFSTLGFGDITPNETTRLPAAFLAVFGNLHLGIIVGAAFFAAQPPASQAARSRKASAVRSSARERRLRRKPLKGTRRRPPRR